MIGETYIVTNKAQKRIIRRNL